MRATFRRSRGLLLALVVLAVSATIVLAAKPESSQTPACEHGQSATHTDQTGCTTPEPGAGDTDTTEQGTEDTEAPKTETDTETESGDAGGDHCATDPTHLSDTELAAMNHGSIVCWAAHQTSWDGYDNHGAFVAHWAHAGKGDHGNSAFGQSHKP